MHTADSHLLALEKEIRRQGDGGICLAFSGGVDSAVVLAVARRVGVPILAVTFETFLHPHGDLDEAKKLAALLGVPHQTIEINELDDPRILDNPPDRCFYCKESLFSRLITVTKEHHLGCVMDGTNEDDLSSYRPGLKALKLLGVVSPLANCHLTKAAVRQLALHLGLTVASKPSAPCLATRLPYGTPLAPDLLARIDRAERCLREMGFSPLRVRIHQEVARIEVDPAQFSLALTRSHDICQALQAEGFSYVTLDLVGFRSGSMDEPMEDTKR